MTLIQSAVVGRCAHARTSTGARGFADRAEPEQGQSSVTVTVVPVAAVQQAVASLLLEAECSLESTTDRAGPTVWKGLDHTRQILSRILAGSCEAAVGAFSRHVPRSVGAAGLQVEQLA